MDLCKAIVERVFAEGPNGPYAIAVAVDRPDISGVVTFSLDRSVWEEERWPEEGSKVFLAAVRNPREGRKEDGKLGWCAREARFWRTSDNDREAAERGRETAELAEKLLRSSLSDEDLDLLMQHLEKGGGSALLLEMREGVTQYRRMAQELASELQKLYQANALTLGSFSTLSFSLACDRLRGYIKKAW